MYISEEKKTSTENHESNDTIHEFRLTKLSISNQRTHSKPEINVTFSSDRLGFQKPKRKKNFSISCVREVFCSFSCHRPLVRVNRCRLYQRHVSFIIYQLKIVLTGYTQIGSSITVLFLSLMCGFFPLLRWNAAPATTTTTVWNVKEKKHTTWPVVGMNLIASARVFSLDWRGDGSASPGNMNKCLFSHNLDGCINILNNHVCIHIEWYKI